MRGAAVMYGPECEDASGIGFCNDRVAFRCDMNGTDCEGKISILPGVAFRDAVGEIPR
jgi:hypothetical protein